MAGRIITIGRQIITDDTPEQKAWEALIQHAADSAPGVNKYTGRVIYCCAGVAMIMAPDENELELIRHRNWYLYDIVVRDGGWYPDDEERERPAGVAIATHYARQMHIKEQEREQT